MKKPRDEGVVVEKKKVKYFKKKFADLFWKVTPTIRIIS